MKRPDQKSILFGKHEVPVFKYNVAKYVGIDFVDWLKMKGKDLKIDPLSFCILSICSVAEITLGTVPSGDRQASGGKEGSPEFE